MTWFIIRSIPVIGVSFLLGLLVGWLWWGRRRSAATSQAAESAAAGPALSAPAVDAQPAVPAQVEPDQAPQEQVAATEPTETEPPTVEAEQAAHTEPPTADIEQAADDVVPGEVPAAADAGDEADQDTKPAPLPVQEKPTRTRAKKTAGADFRRIEGIGPKMSAALVAAGFTSYAELAEADEQALRNAIEAAGLRFAPSLVNWARQAKLIADGDEEGLADLQRRLVAGRDTGRS